MPNRVTMSDVACEVGVSLMTVSRVTNNKGEVSSETRQRVLEIISELGYQPSAIARSLATKKTSAGRLVILDMVSGPPASYSGAGRRRGFLAALREAGIELLEGWIRPCQPLLEGGHETTRRLLGMSPRLTALFCFNELVAVGAPQLKLLGIDWRENPPKWQSP